MKTVALIGRPNVGKSSLFNVLTFSRNALVSDTPGLTRDRNYATININGSKFIIIDTGGIEEVKSQTITQKIVEQTNLAIDESDIIFFIVDGKFGRHNFDDEIAQHLRKKSKKILLIINKTESMSYELAMAEFESYGFKDKVCISASHRIGTNLLQEYLMAHSEPEENIISSNNDSIKISILGKPNVGKSTLINAIVGEERFISFNKPGTTRDSIAVDYYYEDKKLILIDTAGIRKKGKVIDKIEKFSLLKSLLSIENSNLSVLVIDACDGLTSQDLQIMSYIIDSGRPFILVVNKCDILDTYGKKLLKDTLEKKIHFFSNFEIVYISALKKIGLKNIFKSSMRAYNSSRKKIKTSELNNFLNEIQNAHQPPIYKGIRPKLKYAHQGAICPPTIIIHGNHLDGVKKDYLRYIETTLIKTFNLVGTPLKIELVEGKNPYHEKLDKIKKVGLVTRRREINLKRSQIKNKKRS